MQVIINGFELGHLPKNLLHIYLCNLFRSKIKSWIQAFPMQLSNIHKKIYLVFEIYNLWIRPNLIDVCGIYFAAHYVWYAESSKKLHHWNSMMYESTQIWSIQIVIDNHNFSHQCSNNELKHVHEWHENKNCIAFEWKWQNMWHEKCCNGREEIKVIRWKTW
jgi:hypothetical protein